LDDEGQAEVADFVKANSFVSQEQRVYSNTKLNGPELITYPDKASLKRTVVVPIYQRSAFRYVAVAASLAAIIMLWIGLGQEEQQTATMMAESVNTQKSELLQQVEAVHEELKTEGAESLAQQEVIAPVYREEHNKQASPVEVVPYMPLKSVPQLSSNITQEPHLALHDFYWLDKQEYLTQDVPKEKLQEEDDYLSVSRFLSGRFKRKVLKDEGSNEQLALIDVVDAGTRGLNKVLGTKMQVEKEYDDQGNLTAYEFSTPLFGISRSVKHK
jgi:hypothetical protein